jgi:hypothetical protein
MSQKEWAASPRTIYEALLERFFGNWSTADLSCAGQLSGILFFWPPRIDDSGVDASAPQVGARSLGPCSARLARPGRLSRSQTTSGTRKRELSRREPNDNNRNWPIFWGRNGLLPPGFPIGSRPFRPQHRPIWVFIFRLPSAQIPFTGTRQICPNT